MQHCQKQCKAAAPKMFAISACLSGDARVALQPVSALPRFFVTARVAWTALAFQVFATSACLSGHAGVALHFSSISPDGFLKSCMAALLMLVASSWCFVQWWPLFCHVFATSACLSGPEGVALQLPSVSSVAFLKNFVAARSPTFNRLS